jgi:hypothetical protein
VTLRNYQPVAWVLYQRVIDQSKADMLIKPGIIYIIPGLIKMSAFDWSMTRWYKTHATGLLLRDVTLRYYAPVRWR